MTSMQEARRAHQGGQILAVFALALVAIVAMTGLVLDGGFSFVQRRDQQNVADAAAMAAAYAYSHVDTTLADDLKQATAGAAALSVAAANGYTTGSAGVTVSVTFDPPGGAGRHITVDVSKPHQNYFAGIVGMSTWTVSTTATTVAGRPNGAFGAMPIIFNEMAFDTNGAGPLHEVTYPQSGVTGPNPAPQDGTTFNWTMYCDSCNANTSDVTTLIENGGETTVVTIDDKLDPLNSGVHDPLFTSLATQIGKEFPVPIVDSDGRMVGWAMFHLTDAQHGPPPTISGWFVSPVDKSNLVIVDSASAGAGGFGSYIAQLVN